MTEKPKVKPKTFKMQNLDEAKKTTGTSFIIYGPSASRKTRTLGSLGTGSFTLHLSLDGGSNSATDSMRALGIEGAEHRVTKPTSLSELHDIIIALHTVTGYKDKVDNIVIDNFIVVVSWIKEYVSNTPKYKNDTLLLDDVFSNDTSKNAVGSKKQAWWGEVQNLTRQFVSDLLTLKSSYNIFLLASEVSALDVAGVPITTVNVAGPASVAPVVSLFDHCYRTSFKEGDFDSIDHRATFFNISTYTDQSTSMQYFCKNRGINNMEVLKSNMMPADLHIVLTEEMGYIYKANRPKPEPATK